MSVRLVAAILAIAGVAGCSQSGTTLPTVRLPVSS